MEADEPAVGAVPPDHHGSDGLPEGGHRLEQEHGDHHAKGAVRHEEGGRAKRYFPAVDREDAAAAETESFLSRVYGGSLGLMMSAMVESRQLTEADIAELSAILKRAGGEEHA